MKAPYCLKLAVFAAGILCAFLALVLLIAGKSAGASVAFALALTAGFFIPTAARLVERRERADLLARYATRPVAPTAPLAPVVLRVTAAIAVLGLVMAWAQQTPNGDAAVARQACAGSLVAGSESC